MSVTSKALLWAAIIIASALLASGMDINSSASFAVVSGLTGVAWLSVNSGRQASKACTRGCRL